MFELLATMSFSVWIYGVYKKPLFDFLHATHATPLGKFLWSELESACLYVKNSILNTLFPINEFLRSVYSFESTASFWAIKMKLSPLPTQSKLTRNFYFICSLWSLKYALEPFLPFSSLSNKIKATFFSSSFESRSIMLNTVATPDVLSL